MSGWKPGGKFFFFKKKKKKKIFRTRRCRFTAPSSTHREVEAAGFVLDAESTVLDEQETIRNLYRCSIPRSRARPIASPTGL